jgi:hypothetical protein
MERKPYIVLGEAPESDSEEEVNVSVVSIWTVLMPVFTSLMRRVNSPYRNSTVLFQLNFTFRKRI